MLDYLNYNERSKTITLFNSLFHSAKILTFIQKYTALCIKFYIHPIVTPQL